MMRTALRSPRGSIGFPTISFHCLDVLVDELPFEGEFDYVLISHTAHHLPDAYLGHLLEKSAELLRVGCELVVLDMLRPEPNEPFNRQFYFRLDRGEHFRNWMEFEKLFSTAHWFEDVRLHLVKTTKLGIRVILHSSLPPPDTTGKAGTLHLPGVVRALVRHMTSTTCILSNGAHAQEHSTLIPTPMVAQWSMRDDSLI